MFEPGKLLQWEELNYFEKRIIKQGCERSFEYFLITFFQLLEGQEFIRNWHHKLICADVERIYRMETTRHIINVAPGATKTEIISIHFPAWGILKCISEDRPSRWFPLSYSSSLVKANTERIKGILDSKPFQEMWPIEQSKTTKAKDNWIYIDSNGNKHGCFGCSIGGQVTGRRAGYMRPLFTGALLLDDPVSPTMAESALKLSTVNKRINRVCRSRLAHDKVPIIMIQQRVASNDTTTFMMSKEMPDDFSITKIPALIGRDYIRSLPKKIRVQCLQDTGFTGNRVSYWPKKEPTSTLEAMEQADNYMFSSQYNQDPDESLLEGVVFRKEINLMESEGRLCNIPIEKYLPVHTTWDLGINDNMAIWLYQETSKEIRIIACYGNRDEGMEHYINWLHDFRDTYQIRYGTHYAPHDIEVRELMPGAKRIDTAKRMGIQFTTVDRCTSKRESIQALKDIFNRIWIDKVRCDTDLKGRHGLMSEQTGLKALQKLRREWDHDNECFKDQVGPKWATNYTDAIQQMALHRYDKPKDTDTDQTSSKSGSWQGR